MSVALNRAVITILKPSGRVFCWYGAADPLALRQSYATSLGLWRHQFNNYSLSVGVAGFNAEPLR